jgi:pyrophosphate--fructose-6-phosphate 1-phosphotransferase
MLTEKLIQMEKNNSIFETTIRQLPPPVCAIFKQGDKLVPVTFKEQGEELKTPDSQKVAAAFPQTVALSQNRVLYASGALSNPPQGKRVAVLFSGGPAAGGHNVVVGLKHILGLNNTLLGVVAGPKGLIKGELFEIKEADMQRIMNTGGFDYLGSDRTKIKTPAQFESVKKTCKDNKLDAIVVVGGDDSNTNAAVLAEYLRPDGVQVIGVPKTIDGDLAVGKFIPISFGFDTATKIYSELAGNILQDTPSSRKYWHFIKVMGRSASHVALEVALQVKPAICLISEEVAEKKQSLAEVVSQIAQAVIKRAKNGINHGCVIVPEGLIEFVAELKGLIAELNEGLAKHAAEVKNLTKAQKPAFMVNKISAQQARLFSSLPVYIQEMLLHERDAHGNLQVSLIPTEQLLIDMVTLRIKELDASVKFQTQSHFFGYEGRCGAPSLFDAMYTYNLGLIVGSLILDGKTGYIAGFTNLDKGGKALAVPLTGLINLERRHGEEEMVIQKTLVTLDSPAFRFFESRRASWAAEDHFSSPGPRQFWGPVARQIPITVALNQGYPKLEFDM